MFSSTVQILMVEKTESPYKDKVTGLPVQRVAARCILLADDGQPVTVGRLRVPKALVDKVQVGTFRADFALVVPDFGDDKGDIVAQVTNLTPVPVKGASSPAREAAPAK